jgi:hypothetical protein
MSKTRSSSLLSLTTALCLVLTTTAQATHLSSGVQSRQSGAIKTLSPESLQAGQWLGALSFEHSRSDTLSDAELEALADAGVEGVHSVDSISTTSLSLAYGVTSNLTVHLQLPYLNRDTIREGHFDGVAEVERLGDSRGAGDLTVLGQYRFFNQSRVAAALYTGLKLPTGETDEVSDEGERFETEFQPGSGSVDLILGIAAKKSWGLNSLTGSLLYTIAGEGAQDTDLGDQFDYNFAYAYRISGTVADEEELLGPASTHAVDLVLELNGTWRDQEETDGETNPNSGVNIIYLSPGISITSAQGWFASLSLGVPVVTNVKGAQDEPDGRVFVSVGTAF